jgi:hypothetical protein
MTTYEEVELFPEHYATEAEAKRGYDISQRATAFIVFVPYDADDWEAGDEPGFFQVGWIPALENGVAK